MTLWVLQIQLLLQIIINRIALLMMTPKLANRLKWGVAGFILLINISVYCIWVPARLQISDKYIHINNIWDRIEKTIYLIVDGGLNAYFIWLVQAKLVSQGLQKYRPLFKFNIFIVCFSLAMDVSQSLAQRLTFISPDLLQVMLIGTMSLKNSFVYMQFHPVAYIVKLNIEMTMADLIIKIVRSSTRDASYSHSRSGYNPPDVPGSAPRAHLHRRRGSAKRFSVSTGAQGIKGYAGIRSLSENPARPPTSTPPDLPIQGPLKELSEPDKPYGSEFSSTVDIEAVPVRPRDELELDSLHPRASIMKTVATVISSSSAMGRGSVTPDWSQKDEN